MAMNLDELAYIVGATHVEFHRQDGMICKIPHLFLREADTIKSIDGRSVTSFRDAAEQLVKHIAGKNIYIEYGISIGVTLRVPPTLAAECQFLDETEPRPAT